MNGDYEFTASQNVVIGKAATWATALGIVMFVNAALSLLNFPNGIIQAVISLFLGINFFRSGKAFKSVVDTQGNDVAHLLQALDRVGTAFQIRLIVTLVGVVLMLVALVVFVVFAGSR